MSAYVSIQVSVICFAGLPWSKPAFVAYASAFFSFSVSVSQLAWRMDPVGFTGFTFVFFSFLHFFRFRFLFLSVNWLGGWTNCWLYWLYWLYSSLYHTILLAAGCTHSFTAGVTHWLPANELINIIFVFE